MTRDTSGLNSPSFLLARRLRSHRLGIPVLGKAGIPTREVRCLAELLPLAPDESVTPEGLVLFLVPDRSAAVRGPAAPPEPRADRHSARRREGLLDHPEPAAAVDLRGTLEPDSPSRPSEQAPAVWVRSGWRHLLPNQFPVPAGEILLLRPPGEVAAARRRSRAR